MYMYAIGDVARAIIKFASIFISLLIVIIGCIGALYYC